MSKIKLILEQKKTQVLIREADKSIGHTLGERQLFHVLARLSDAISKWIRPLQKACASSESKTALRQRPFPIAPGERPPDDSAPHQEQTPEKEKKPKLLAAEPEEIREILQQSPTGTFLQILQLLQRKTLGTPTKRSGKSYFRAGSAGLTTHLRKGVVVDRKAE